LFLLNFICPEIFVDYADLDSFLHKDETVAEEEEEEKSKKAVEVPHKILRPFLLRRVKSDMEKNLLLSGCPFSPRAVFALLIPRIVEQKRRSINIYVGLTEMQRTWYRSILEKDIDGVNGKCD
jgi:SWI/SNF-related matrix-associated actin-dependent regulator of chromatin subfamily A member 5